MIGLAVGGAAAFGAADYLAGAATDRAGSVRRVLSISEPIAAVALLVAIPLSPAPLTTAAIGWGAAAGLAAGAGQVLLYTTLARDATGAGAPLCGVASVVVPVLWAAAIGRPIRLHEWVAFLLLAAAVVSLCGTTRSGAGLDAAVTGAGAGAAFGIYSGMLAASPPGSSLWPVVIAHATVAALTAATRITADARSRGGHRRALQPIPTPGPTAVLAAAVGLLEALAAAAILTATHIDLAIAGAVAAVHPAVTVLLARLLGRKALGRQRIAGLVLSCTGVFILSGV